MANIILTNILIKQKALKQKVKAEAKIWKNIEREIKTSKKDRSQYSQLNNWEKQIDEFSIYFIKLKMHLDKRIKKEKINLDSFRINKQLKIIEDKLNFMKQERIKLQNILATEKLLNFHPEHQPSSSNQTFTIENLESLSEDLLMHSYNGLPEFSDPQLHGWFPNLSENPYQHEQN